RESTAALKPPFGERGHFVCRGHDGEDGRHDHRDGETDHDRAAHPRSPSLWDVRTRDSRPADHPPPSGAAHPRADIAEAAPIPPNRTRRALEFASPSPGTLLQPSWEPRHALPPAPNRPPTSSAAGSLLGSGRLAESVG